MKLKNVIKVSFWTLISRVLGLLRDILLSRYLGAGFVSDAFFVAFKIPNLFRRLFAEGSMQSAFIPIFNKIFHQDEVKARQFANAIFTIMVFTLLLLLIVLEIWTPVLVSIISPGFLERGEEVFNLCVFLTRITLPYLFFISITSFYSALLNSLGKFAVVAFLPTLLNIAMIVLMFFNQTNVAQYASIGVFVGGVLQLILVGFWVYKNKWLVRFTSFNLLSSDVKLFYKKIIPVVLGAGVYQINIIIDTVFASLLAFGTISYLFYADRIYQLPLSLIGIAIGSVILPSLSKAIQQNNNQANEIKTKAILFALLFSLCATVGLIVFANEIIVSIFVGGEFSMLDAKITANMLAIYAISLPFNIIIKVLLPIFYANSNTKTPLYSTLFSLIINFILVAVFVLLFSSQYGIAIATTVSSIFNFIVLWVVLQKKYTIVFDSKFKIELFKILTASAVILLASLVFKAFLMYFIDTYFANIIITRLFLCSIVLFIIVLLFVILKKLKSSIYLEFKNLKNQ
jgi:putative peptidoglycan lipid II flippase